MYIYTREVSIKLYKCVPVDKMCIYCSMNKQLMKRSQEQEKIVLDNGEYNKLLLCRSRRHIPTIQRTGAKKKTSLFLKVYRKKENIFTV